MNNKRREALADISRKLYDLKCEIQCLQEDEEYAFSNLPENLQNGERGEKMEEAIDSMDDAVCQIEDAIANIEDAVA